MNKKNPDSKDAVDALIRNALIRNFFHPAK